MASPAGPDLPMAVKEVLLSLLEGKREQPDSLAIDTGGCRPLVQHGKGTNSSKNKTWEILGIASTSSARVDLAALMHSRLCISPGGTATISCEPSSKVDLC
jgi:hypothetical protein